jgi:hypothetical protein
MRFILILPWSHRPLLSAELAPRFTTFYATDLRIARVISGMLCPWRRLRGICQVNIVHAIPRELFAAPEPSVFVRVPIWLPAMAFGPFDIGRLVEDVGFDQGADVRAHAVVQVAMLAYACI